MNNQESQNNAAGVASALTDGLGVMLTTSSWNTAEACRAMGIEVGDTIIGREEFDDPFGYSPLWNEARLTLLWLGESVAVWREQLRSSEKEEWSEPDEAADWTLDSRPWRKLAHNAGIEAPPLGGRLE